MALSVSACDQGTPETESSQGPPLRVIATFPTPGLGTECAVGALDTCFVPFDRNIEIAFDRFLLPSTAIRQSVTLCSGPDDCLFLQPEYDVVRRVLVYKVSMKPQTRYTLEMLSPKSDDDFGFRAFDRAVLAEGDVPLTFDFITSKGPSNPAAPTAPPTCSNIIDDFATSTGPGCSSSTCHNAQGSSACPPGQGQDVKTSRCVPVPRMGLDLSTSDGLLFTAINHVAHETETGNKAGVPLENPSRFGTQMPIIDPGRPENSYMMYKLIRRDQNYDNIDCKSGLNVFANSGDCRPPEGESLRLREWFVRGEGMPLVDTNGAVPIDPLAVQDFIRAGAKCP